MPFTFSHPAIVMPFSLVNRKWISMSGLIMGSMVPDFEYFLRMRIKSNYSHTISGILLFDLPLAIVILFIFHLLVRNRLNENLPAFFKSRFSVFEKFNWIHYFKNNWITVIASIVAGTVSHLVWDNFTHEQGFFVIKMPVLFHKIYFWGSSLAVFKILQHASTMAGALIIAFAIYKMPLNIPENQKISFRYWIMITALTFIIVACRLFLQSDLMHYGTMLVTFLAALFISLVITSLIYSFHSNPVKKTLS